MTPRARSWRGRRRRPWPRRGERGRAALTGEIQQVPARVSAIKVGGERAYRLARGGAAPELAPRTVTVLAFTVDGPAAAAATCWTWTWR